MSGGDAGAVMGEDACNTRTEILGGQTVTIRVAHQMVWDPSRRPEGRCTACGYEAPWPARVAAEEQVSLFGGLFDLFKEVSR